ncbi:hypothetical protein K450DRAFT_240382 [Umbelopsis ramanniana AG]|uniref:sphingomyelin phosphodiesterase n=1 Tax=Umbelopsis ramanniana AG TaxID=1314678 RepID=A0AAD5HF89_UMBRA|nr:uncharacterized protein K450DRAFT_240382 [Umbelopsis ramanniana AG]KAI8579798.1 hypothetical protein K450DRAFT_240382 [Umbelopsis ramanniana AG]
MSDIQLPEDDEEQQLYERETENTPETPLIRRSQSHESIISTLSAPPAYELYPPATTWSGRLLNFFRRIPTRFTQSSIALPTLSDDRADERSISSRFRIPQLELHPRIARWRYPIVGLCVLCITIFSFLLFCSIFFSPASLPSPSVPDKIANDTAKFLTLNIFMRPPGVKNNWSDYKDDRTDFIIRHVLPNYDVVSFQESFGFGSRRKDHLIRAAREMGYNHHVESGRKYPWQIAVDGGLLVLSRFPIKDSRLIEYPRGRHSDWMARKGAIYAQIECKPNSLVHLYTTHAQASYQQITSLWDDDVRTRMNQFSWLHSLIAETSGKDGSAVVLNGDLNVDAAVHKEKSSPTEPSEESSEEYEFMKAVLSGEGKKINGKVEYEDSWKIDLKDAVYESYGFHPVTFGDVKVDEYGMVVPAETVLTDADELMAVQSIDHVLWSPRQSNMNIEGVRVEKFMVADTHLDNDEDEEKGYTQVSDHYGISYVLRL